MGIGITSELLRFPQSTLIGLIRLIVRNPVAAGREPPTQRLDPSDVLP